MFGKKQDSLEGSLGERKQRWKMNARAAGMIKAAIRDEPVVFRVVD
jgi:hypothetical protein